MSSTSSLTVDAFVSWTLVFQIAWLCGTKCKPSSSTTIASSPITLNSACQFFASSPICFSLNFLSASANSTTYIPVVGVGTHVHSVAVQTYDLVAIHVDRALFLGLTQLYGKCGVAPQGSARHSHTRRRTLIFSPSRSSNTSRRIAVLLVWADMILRAARNASLIVRQHIVDRFELGDTQLQIAKDLGISPASVRYYLRLAGVPSAVYGKKIETAEGKWICSRCGRPKTAGAFTSKRSTVCRMCYKA
jgi:hypothetical protein